MDNTVKVSILNGASCEAHAGEAILSAFIRCGIAMSAPCGGRGICGRCRLTLISGTARYIDSGKEIKEAEVFCACRAAALSDISVSMPEEIVPGLPFAVLPSEIKNRRAGVALDIGTTTIHAELIDLDSGESLELVSVLNNQRSFGVDVISRISAAREGKAPELSSVLNSQIEGILRQFIQNWKLEKIEQCTVSANTTMLHFFAGVNPGLMGEAPYTPVFLEEKRMEGRELSLSADTVTLLPGISAFVGADIVSGLAFIDIMNRQQDALFIDIGTNGELALWNNSRKSLYCSSTAAGPCFEGAEISCGMGALPGAINRVSLKEDPAVAKWTKFGSLYYSVIGNTGTQGICGTGLIDAIAIMKKMNIFDENGALTKEYAWDGFPVTLEIFVNQKDVRRFQLAKSAIFSGINTLCKIADVKSENIGTAYIAGALGFYINLENAVDVGLLPGGLLHKAAVCGNTSLKGAAASFTDPGFLPRCREIAAHSKTVDLAGDSEFSDIFMDNLGF
jgi:uncharacterized 2Fe-2S/4Fe-4S cluster protein (DUF4445 family)